MSFNDRSRSAHPSPRRATRAAVALAACAASLTVVTSAQAATATWTCGADAVTTSVVGTSTLNPITARRTPCSDQSVGLPNTTSAIGLAPTINARTAYAITSAKPPTARPIQQSVGGAAGIAGLSLQTAGGTVVIGVDAAQSAATGTCQNGKALLAGTSQVTGLTIKARRYRWTAC